MHATSTHLAETEMSCRNLGSILDVAIAIHRHLHFHQCRAHINIGNITMQTDKSIFISQAYLPFHQISIQLHTDWHRTQTMLYLNCLVKLIVNAVCP